MTIERVRDRSVARTHKVIFSAAGLLFLDSWWRQHASGRGGDGNQGDGGRDHDYVPAASQS